MNPSAYASVTPRCPKLYDYDRAYRDVSRAKNKVCELCFIKFRVRVYTRMTNSHERLQYRLAVLHRHAK